MSSPTPAWVNRVRRGLKAPPLKKPTVMLIAKASGTVVLDGETIAIRAGRDRVDASHDVVKLAPHLFGLATDARTSSSSSRPRRSSDEVELRTSSVSPIAVVLQESAKTGIVNEVLEHASNYPGEGRESGGYLFGKRRRSSSPALGPKEPDLLEVTFAAYAGEGTQRGRSSMTHDYDYARSVERALRRRGRDRLVGDYHSHPEGSGVPSKSDLLGWLRSFQYLGVQNDDKRDWLLLGDEVTPNCYVGLIVTRSAGGSWMYPQLHGWITRWEDYSGFICEPALIEGG